LKDPSGNCGSTTKEAPASKVHVSVASALLQICASAEFHIHCPGNATSEICHIPIKFKTIEGTVIFNADSEVYKLRGEWSTAREYISYSHTPRKIQLGGKYYTIFSKILGNP
jgi:hypothetical protein